MQQGDIIALVNYMGQILIELVKLANLIIQVTRAAACAGRIRKVLDIKPGMEFPRKSMKGGETSETAVRFDGVCLRYAGAGEESLSDISFVVKKGETVGVIGGTGSGKTSLVNLIPRFYDAVSGKMCIRDRPMTLERPETRQACFT